MPAPTRWSASPSGATLVCFEAGGRWPGRVGRGPWGLERLSPACPLPPAPPSLSAFAPSPGWLDRRGLAPDLRGAPQVFNDSLKVAVGKVERDEADVGRVSLLCNSRKESWEPCGWPQAPAPRPQPVGGGAAAAASPIPLPSLARCALQKGPPVSLRSQGRSGSEHIKAINLS